VQAGHFLLALAYHTGVLTVWRHARARFLNPAEVVTYHRVSGSGCRSDLPTFLKGISVERFEEQIAHLARTYEVVPLELLVECIRQRKPWPRHALAVTFDDGYQDNYEYAYPVLRKYQIPPATIFLAAGCIEERQILWWDQIHQAVLHYRHWPSPSDLPPNIYPTKLRRRWETYDASSIEGRVTISQELVRQLKVVPDEVRLAVMDDLLTRLGVPLRGVDSADVLLSWAEVREMADGGIVFGSHTLTHPALDQVDSYKLRREVEDSKSLIESRLQRPVYLFAYPGGSGAASSNVQRVLRRAGFWGAVTNQGYSNTINIDPFRIGRWYAPDESLAVFGATVAGIFYGWPTIYRKLFLRNPNRSAN